MVEDNEHVQRLIAARDREVAHRRNLVERLAEKHDRGVTENMTGLRNSGVIPKCSIKATRVVLPFM